MVVMCRSVGDEVVIRCVGVQVMVVMCRSAGDGVVMCRSAGDGGDV